MDKLARVVRHPHHLRKMESFIVWRLQCRCLKGKTIPYALIIIIDKEIMNLRGEKNTGGVGEWKGMS